MTELKQRDLVLLSYPFSDFTSKKVRPAIILSKNNEEREDIILVPLTTNLNVRDYSFLLKSIDLEEGELLKESKVKVDRIFSASKSLIVSKIGSVKEEIHKKILQSLLRQIE